MDSNAFFGIFYELCLLNFKLSRTVLYCPTFYLYKTVAWLHVSKY